MNAELCLSRGDVPNIHDVEGLVDDGAELHVCASADVARFRAFGFREALCQSSSASDFFLHQRLLLLVSILDNVRNLWKRLCN